MYKLLKGQGLRYATYKEGLDAVYTAEERASASCEFCCFTIQLELGAYRRMYELLKKGQGLRYATYIKGLDAVYTAEGRASAS